MRLSVELCAVYWHFLLLVWLALFVVLLQHPSLESDRRHMTQSALDAAADKRSAPAGCRASSPTVVGQAGVQDVPWGKAMMWIFLLSDTFIFARFLTSYMTVRMSTTAPWPNPSEVFALTHRRARASR